jgi:hypothetical protein
VFNARHITRFSRTIALLMNTDRLCNSLLAALCRILRLMHPREASLLGAIELVRREVKGAIGDDSSFKDNRRPLFTALLPLCALYVSFTLGSLFAQSFLRFFLSSSLFSSVRRALDFLIRSAAGLNGLL